MRMKLPDVSSPNGAPMGRINVLPDDCKVDCKLHLERLRWIDSCYDQGGAYWGTGNYIYWAYGDVSGFMAQVFVRAKDRRDAKAQVQVVLPNSRFYR